MMTSQAAILMINEGLSSSKIENIKTEVEMKAVLNEICNRICVHAWKNLNSKDNITIAIIMLKWAPTTRPTESRHNEPHHANSYEVGYKSDQQLPNISVALVSNDQSIPTIGNEVRDTVNDDDVMKFLLDDANF